MAVPLIVGAGLALFATAKLFSWLANSMTEEEERKQEKERARTESIRRRAETAKARQEREAWEEYRTMVLEHVQLLRRVTRENRDAIVGIPEELDKLEQMVAREISDRTSSPYRKSALRREYARIEDAVVRMKEYERYLVFAENEVDALLANEGFEQLLAIDPAEKILPLEWLYPGKLVLVAMDEINKPFPRFGHRIVFGRDDVPQKALAIPFNDEIPILVKATTKWDSGSFYGCVARGSLYYNHIIPGEPVSFTVERKQKQSMIGTLFDGMVRATLPISQLKHPGVRMLPGQKVLVHPTQYDLCLVRNPFEQGRSSIEVSEFDYRARGVQSYQQLYLTVDETHLQGITDQQFFEGDQPWTLLGYSATTGMISLGKASVRVECAPTNDFSLLEIRQTIQLGTLQVGLDTPFRFTLLDRKLATTSKVGWRSGVEEFLRFCSQTAMDMKDSPVRLAQSRFYQRWEQVIAYQRRQEEVSTLDFSVAALARQEDDVFLISRESLPVFDHQAFEELTDKLREVLSDKNKLNPDHCVRLQLWDANRSEFVPANSDRRRRPLYQCTKNSITIESAISLPENTSEMLRLVVNLPSAALKRQAQALEDFFNDQLVNPALKSILLAPEHYIAQPQERSSAFKWSGPLDESQKRVVELALKERNIALIQGPPGAGKTTAIVEILYQLYRQRSDLRILVVSQQNSAVDNALEKFLAEHASGFEQAIRTIRIGNPEKMSQAIKPLGFDSQFTEYLKSLEDLAIAGAVSLPENEAALCHMWLSSIKQASQSRANQDEFFITLLADRNLVGATCVGMATNKGGIDQLQFDVAIIDEAGRATIPEILIPILRSNKVILVGDHYQLPPSIAPLLREDEAAEELGFLRESFLDNSFFELMFERLPSQCRETLSLQYRMAPAIGDLVAKLFYTREGTRVLHNGREDRYFDERYVLENTIYWIDVKGHQAQPKGSKSQENREEAKEITRFLTSLAETKKKPISVAVITPYGAQKECIRSSLRSVGWKDGRLDQLSIAVDTVDAFQGSEADIVCYSTVRTEGNLNFILDRKRLNVACSRAKLHLLFFGHRDFLRRWNSKKGSGENMFPKLMQHAWNVPVSFRARNNKNSLSEGSSNN